MHIIEVSHSLSGRSRSSGGVRKAFIGALLVTSASAAYAQDAGQLPASAAAEAAEPSEITVTGSRIARSGYDQPTPVTVIDESAIQAGAEPNLADFVNQIPSVVGSTTPANTQRNLSGGTAGLNTINLRNLGSNRTLILLDGRRSVASSIVGTVDINTIPQGLVKTVEVVTGGASSVYGSDAVAGVVNFVLDKEFTGIKGEVQYGETTYGDDENFRINLSAGMKFAGGRGHILVSGNYVNREGVLGAPRPWANDNMHLIQNPGYLPGNGQPELVASTRTGLNTLSAGGIITAPLGSQSQASRDLVGTYFGVGGTINQYNFGESFGGGPRLSNSPWTLGGDFALSQHFDQTSLQPGENVKGLFGRLSYEVGDNFEVFAEATYNQSKSTNVGGYFTSKGNITVNTRNPFIPEPLRTEMIAAGIGDFRIGSWDVDLPSRKSNNDRRVQRYVVGFNGGFDALGTDWGIDGYYQHGVSNVRVQLNEIINRTKLGYARDAVIDSATGNIVCRSTAARIADPLFAGCVPYNSFGIGVNSQDAINYIIGDPYTDQKYQQDVAAINFSTSIANSFIDPIGLAFGVEHRRESVDGFVEDQFRSGWVVGNFEASQGSFNVTEAYIETLFTLPLGFEFSGAARYTDYSQSGSVVTWKTGLTWQPIDDLRLRFTRSRDIRAPNLSELFQAGSRNTNSVADPWQGRDAVRYTQTVTGNLDLDPEKADTLGLGLVYRPSYLPGFGFSVDYYDIKIKGAIGNVTPQQIMDRCFDGTNPQLCERLQAIVGSQVINFGQSGFTQAGGAPGVEEFLIANSPFNFLSERARGIDFEASYRFSLDNVFSNAPGDITLRAVASRFLEASTDNGVEAEIDTAGQNTFGGPPNWTYRATLDYSIPDTFSFQLVGRGLSGGVYNNDWTECQTNCPDPVGNRFRTIADNKIPGAFYLDTFLAYTLPIDSVKPQLFLQVRNLLNEDPVKVGKGPSDTSNPDTGINQTLYDFLGRSFRIGLRFNFAG